MGGVRRFSTAAVHKFPLQELYLRRRAKRLEFVMGCIRLVLEGSIVFAKRGRVCVHE